jgi:hypothetical protein
MAERWHVPAAQIGDYLTDRLDQPTASSVEAHLLGCPACREAVARRSDPASLAASWESLERAVDDRDRSWVVRVGRRAGLSDRDARTLAPTASLKAGWPAATLMALLASAALARRAGGAEEAMARLVFLTIAPLAPLAAVVAALGAASEPAPEISRAAPASRLRIGAVRALVVLTGAVGVGALASVVVPGDLLDAVVWLLPALAVSGLGALVAGRWPFAAAVAWPAATWVVTVAVVARMTGDRLGAFRPGAQVAYLAVAVAVALAIALRPHSLDLGGTP